MARLIRWGEVRWYQFARPDKRRPVLVLTRSSAIEYLGQLTIAPLTTTIRDIPTEVALSPIDGVALECAVNLDHVQTVDRGKIGARLCTLPKRRLDEVRRALLFALGFNR